METVDPAGLVVRAEMLSVEPWPSPALEDLGLGFFDPDKRRCLFPAKELQRFTGPLLPLKVYDLFFARAAGTGWVQAGPVPDTAEVVLLSFEVLGTLEVPFDIKAPSPTQGS